MRADTHPGWLSALRRYLVVTVLGHVVWESAQLPLYTLWRTGTPREIAFAVAHCSVGDVVIASIALLFALVAFGTHDWPRVRFGAVAVTAIAVGLAYTAFSEYLNTVVRKSWAYSDFMPVVPWLGVGVSPVLQWLVIPPLALASSRRAGFHLPWQSFKALPDSRSPSMSIPTVLMGVGPPVASSPDMASFDMDQTGSARSRIR
jgi:hypothetical protein